MKRIILLALITASFVSQATVKLKIGTSGYVTIDGNNYPRGQVYTYYSYGSDTTLQITANNLNTGAHTKSYYLDGDNSNTPFASMAALKAWNNTNLELGFTGGGGTGDASAANQVTQINSLSNIDISTTNGVTPYRLLSAATTNATNISAVPATMYYVYATNSGAAARFVKIYDKATAPDPTVDVPIMTLRLAPLTGIVTLPITKGVTFNLGISFLITALIGDTDATAVGLNDVALNIGYK